MKRKGRKAKLNFLILLKTPPLDIAADHHRVPPLKFLLPGAHWEQEFITNDTGYPMKNHGGCLGAHVQGNSLSDREVSLSAVNGRNIQYSQPYFEPSTDAKTLA